MLRIYIGFILALFYFGYAIMGLELLSSNLMAPYFGGSVYIWGSIIGSFMVQMSIGYVTGGYLSKRFERFRPLPLFLFVASVWIFFLPFVVAPVGDWLSNAIFDVRLASLLAMNILFFIPIMLMAMVSPYILGLIGQYLKFTGLSAGVVLFISTFGSFAGTILTSFYLIAYFPISKIIHAMGIIGVLLSIFLFFMNLDASLRNAFEEKKN